MQNRLAHCWSKSVKLAHTEVQKFLLLRNMHVRGGRSDSSVFFLGIEYWFCFLVTTSVTFNTRKVPVNTTKVRMETINSKAARCPIGLFSALYFCFGNFHANGAVSTAKLTDGLARRDSDSPTQGNVFWSHLLWLTSYPWQKYLQS